MAKVVLDNPAGVARRSITEVADAAGTSETTVTRFCKAIGVGGYPELRIALAADTARAEARSDRDLGGEIGPDDDLAEVVGKVAFADARAVEETADQLDMASLQQVVDAIAARRPGRRLRRRRERFRRRRTCSRSCTASAGSASPGTTRTSC